MKEVRMARRGREKRNETPRHEDTKKRRQGREGQDVPCY
jgi:hypothetical protein